MAPALPSNDFSLIALIYVFTHSLENEKSRQLHGGREMKSEPQARGRGRCAEHLLLAALFLGAALKEDMWEGGYS